MLLRGGTHHIWILLTKDSSHRSILSPVVVVVHRQPVAGVARSMLVVAGRLHEVDRCTAADLRGVNGYQFTRQPDRGRPHNPYLACR